MNSMNIGSRSEIAATYEKVELHAEIEGASSHELIDLLLKGAIVKLAKAKGHIQQNNVAEKGQEISKVITIVAELQQNLVTSQDNVIANSLADLYSYITDLIVTANITDDSLKIDEASHLISHIRESWSLIPDDQRY